MIKLNEDCLILLFNELQTDKNALYSCLLVNREWCRLVVPILWKKHLYVDIKKLFKVILSWLPSSSRQLLSDSDIKLPSTILSKPSLFNYISFCEFPNPIIIDRITGMALAKRRYSQNERNLIEQELYKFFVSKCKNIKELRWKTSQNLSSFSGASACFSQLFHLNIDIRSVNSNALHEMAQICRDLNKLSIYNYSQDLSGLISLIDAQRNLKSVVLCNIVGTCEELSKALARKSSTINYLELGHNSGLQPSFLASFINLKGLMISDGDEYQQFFAISEFPDLRFLDVKYLPCFKELATLIEKTNGNITEVWIVGTNRLAKNTGMLIKSIANNCPKIETLSIPLVANDFIHVKSLLINCRNLNFIKLKSLNNENDNNENDNTGDELLNFLTKFFPKSLTQIVISDGWKYSIDAFERFFERCGEQALKYFEIRHSGKKCYITEDHIAIVRKYIKYINEGKNIAIVCNIYKKGIC